MDYTTSLIERSKDDQDGQRLCDMIAAHLTYLSNNGLDGFLLVPIQSAGTTTGVIIAARGAYPGFEQGRKAFKELTGFDDPAEL